MTRKAFLKTALASMVLGVTEPLKVLGKASAATPAGKWTLRLLVPATNNATANGKALRYAMWYASQLCIHNPDKGRLTVVLSPGRYDMTDQPALITSGNVDMTGEDFELINSTGKL